MDMACKLGRATRPAIKLGICGIGGDPDSVKFCHRIGVARECSLLPFASCGRWPPGRNLPWVRAAMERIGSCQE